MHIIQEGQAQMLDYLKRADERGERQSRATLKALTTIQDGQKVLFEGQKALYEGLKVLQDGQRDIATLTARTLELTRDIHRKIFDKKSSQH
jgi:hypothetical protein